jgi:hypothetical protein
MDAAILSVITASEWPETKENKPDWKKIGLPEKKRKKVCSVGKFGIQYD